MSSAAPAATAHRPNDGAAAANDSSSAPPPSKVPRTTTPTPEHPGNAQLWHQRTVLHTAYHHHHGANGAAAGGGGWHGRGHTTMYLWDTTNAGHQLALHGRDVLRVEHVSVETVDPTSSWRSLQATSMVSHADPLTHILVPPASTLKVDDQDSPRCLADAQCIRGAVGMTNALRAAGIASHLGEMRISYDGVENTNHTTAKTTNDDDNTNSQQKRDGVQALWLQDLQRGPPGHWQPQQQEDEEQQRGQQRHKRLSHVAQRLANPPAGTVALKVQIEFTYGWKNPTNTAALPQEHFGGVHVLHGGGGNAPHVYTTAGHYGDGNGPRCWMPCLDSSAVVHRASQELVVMTTGPAAAALQCLGAGETAGVHAAYGHAAVVTADSDHVERLRHLLGNDHVKFLDGLPHPTQSSRQSSAANGTTATHVIPPDRLSWAALQVTHVWSTASWTPVPVRSLGWAIGPWVIVEDPEYFSRVLRQADEEEAAEQDDDDMDTSLRRIGREERLREFMAAVRRRGEGIRQAYFLPQYARTHHFVNEADWSMLNNPTFRLKALTAAQREEARNLRDAVTRATVGVVHRALSLMRDVLALPTYRTVSYTQIWIPQAVDGGCTAGSLVDCPEVACNAFLGGAIADARLLPPPQARLPYAMGGGRVLQYLQARAAIRGWVRAALPLGGDDDVGFGYLHGLVEALLFSLYERGHGGYGEGGGKGGFFYSRRYGPSSGLNSSQLDFLPIRNVEDMSFVGTAVEERQTDHLWRSTVNGSESHTSALDEFQVRNMIGRDVVEALERGADKDEAVPTGSMGWLGSHLSLTFLSSNATSSSLLGCGSVEMMHPVSGLVYQCFKTNAFRGIVEGRAGIANFVRLIRAAFIAAHLSDLGEKELKLPQRRSKKTDDSQKPSGAEKVPEEEQPKPPFVVCVNEILNKKGLTHTLFTRALQNMCGRLREGFLAGTLVDVERMSIDPRTRQPFVDPEGFPNSFVRAASTMYCCVGVHVEPSRDSGTSAATKNVQVQLYAEPVVTRGGVAYGGPITVRIVENEGQFREYVKDLIPDGSRRDWGAQMLHTKPVTTAKAQTAASGAVESAKDKKSKDANAGELAETSSGSVFTESNFHIGGYQAIELIRLTNLTPLLWVRIDPLGMYGGKISVSQPDACLAEQLFYDGDASAQLEAIRALAERPLAVQPPTKITAVYDVNISELPIRVLADCLRGSPALHSSLSHTPVVRANAALAMAQWQNNKAPPTRDSVNSGSWIGLNLLLQYFKERFYSNAVIMPVKFTRIAYKKNEAETRAAAAANNESGAGVPKATHDDGFYYFDSLGEGSERAAALSEAEDVETEEDEEYRVRAACVAAIASVRAKGGQTPSTVIKFLETILESEDASMMNNVVHPDDDMVVEKTFRKMKADAKEKDNDAVEENEDGEEDMSIPSLPYISSMLVADTLLALCHINISPATYTDPTTGEMEQVAGMHPVAKLMELALGWLDWELYRERIRRELHASSRTGISGNCFDLVAPCAIVSLANLAILRQSTTSTENRAEGEQQPIVEKLEKVTRAGFYADLFDARPLKNDLTRAASAQAFTSLCCASDRLKDENTPSLGLLTALEFLLNRIVQTETSPTLRHTLAALMMDACTGKVSSMQRVGAIAGRNDLFASASRFFNGPLGASHGGDNGSAVVMSVSAATHPSASAVNDGARRGLGLIRRAGHPRMSAPESVIVRIAVLGTRLWRTINGEKPDPTPTPSVGVCAYDGALRCSLLALWQWLWPKGCYAILAVQSYEQAQSWKDGRPALADSVMTITDDEKEAAKKEDNALSDLSRLVDHEIDRQAWRGEMASKAYELFRNGKQKVDVAAAEQGLGQPLPPIARDASFKQGGWIASWAQQRRELALDGGGTVTKVRLKVGGK